ncbi:hypothetical protein [Pseudomonas sp. MPB26]|uniref:hypothetical protein n=1 Tax=Pseudomonas sp. MPB26 TaxID=3388491 RepID=UPI0039851827
MNRFTPISSAPISASRLAGTFGLGIICFQTPRRVIADLSAVEVMAARAVESATPSKVFDIWIEPDGTASYTCGFFAGEMEDELVDVRRNQEGVLSMGG